MAADTKQIAKAAEVLDAGGVVCFPTESSYGLAARIDRPSACALIASLKQRDANSPFPVIVASRADAISLSSAWPTAATDLVARHWPGPLTIVVPARSGLLAEVVGSSGGVGIRVSSHPIAHALATCAGPITATSANRRGQTPARTIGEARVAFADEPVAYLDGGECSGRNPSTVVSVSPDGRIEMIRSGAIELAEMV